MTEKKKILLNDFLKLPTDSNEFKVKFNQFDGELEPLQEYLKAPDKQEQQNNRWTGWRRGISDFAVGQKVLLLMKMKDNLWLLTSIREITKDSGIPNSYAYESVELKDYEKFYGRIVVRFSTKFRQNIPYYSTVWQDMEVFEILPEQYSGRVFPGVTEIRIPLAEIIQLNNADRRDWITPLQNQKGIYLIIDKSEPDKEGIPVYVGSASGKEGLWQRWLDYANTSGTGGDIALQELIEKNPNYGIEHFTFAVLETFGSNADTEEILRRESWWKETLGTRAKLNRN